MVVTPIHPRNMVVPPPRQQAVIGVDSGINLAYIYPVQGFWQQAMRFVTAYRQFPPLIGHRTVVIVNGAKAPDPLRSLFRSLPMVRYFMHDNSGWDIGGYIHLSRSVPPETVLFCCSTYCYFKKAGWLRRMNEVWQQNGPGLYGTIATYEVRPHFCTTGFMTTAGLLCKYQKPTNTKEERYAFEHGPEHFVSLCLNEGVPVRLVTWDGVYPVHEWRKAPNIYCRGNQSNCLTYFNHGDSYERSDQNTKRRRESDADTLRV